jgi:hypothetical protein
LYYSLPDEEMGDFFGGLAFQQGCDPGHRRNSLDISQGRQASMMARELCATQRGNPVASGLQGAGLMHSCATA